MKRLLGRSLLIVSSLLVIVSGITRVALLRAQGEQPAATVDWSRVDQALGRSGQLTPGDVYRVGIPRSDLQVSVEGIPVEPAFALGSYAAFKYYPDEGHAMVMDDLVLLDEEVPAVMSGLTQDRLTVTGDFVLLGSEVNPVIGALQANGIEVAAIHNHALRDDPRLFYMHFWANDDPMRLAQGLRAALDLTNSRGA